MPRSRKTPSPSWRAFLENHVGDLVSIDFFTVPTAPESPWQNPYVERLIGSIRRECLDHLVVINARHLHRILGRYFDYYHRYERRASV